ncbi:MAG TPA: hypothetical protein VMT64_15140, partial [Candidatus Binataceae bacterium]|nr:hypothetical protein [Candidatus Binataceae bacterium]
MNLLRGLAAGIAGAFRDYLLPWLRAIFGSFRWTPPTWLQRISGYLAAATGRTAAWLDAYRKASPLRFWIAGAVLLALIVAGYSGIQWYRHLPEPHYLEATVSQPRPTRFDPEQAAPSDEPNASEGQNPQPSGQPGVSFAPGPPASPNAQSGGRLGFWRRHLHIGARQGTAGPQATAAATIGEVRGIGSMAASAPAMVQQDLGTPTPDPVVIHFSGSAARLDTIGKPVTSGITVTPPIAGQWKWLGDADLQFTPKNDWPVGQHYTVKFDRKLFPSHIRLKKYSYPMSSPSFAAAIESAEFYEDPTDPKIKQVVATIRFTHPIDKTDFEKRISFRMRVEPVKSFDSREATSLGFKVTYDKAGGKAYIRSDAIEIPPDDGEVLLTIGRGVRSSRGGPGAPAALERTVNIPGIRNYFRIRSIAASNVSNDRDEMERIGTISASAPMRQADLEGDIAVFLLPTDKPAIGDQAGQKEYSWSGPLEVVPEVMKLATPVPIEWIPAEREFSDTQSFRFSADSGRFLLVTVRRGLKSFGGYPLVKDYSQVISVAPFPHVIKIVSEGSLLSLSGEKKISILTRSVGAIHIEVSRLLPGTVSHLVSQSNGTFSLPDFSYSGMRFGFDDLSEILSEARPLPSDPTGKNQYSVFDFAPLMSSGALPHGLFWLKIEEWDPDHKQIIQGGTSDARLILLTDLGLVV